MKSLLSAVCALTLAGQAIAYSDSEAIQRLGRHLDTIQNQAHKERLVGGSLMTGLGVAGGVGFFIARNSSDPDTRNTLAPVLGIVGGAFIIAGVLQLTMPTEYETLPNEFKLAPDAELKAKLTVGEDILRRLAANAKRDRLIGAGTLAAIGIAQIVWYAASDRSLSSKDWLIYSGIANAGIGALYFFLPRQPEDEYEAYRAWKGETKASAELNFTLIATRGLPAPALLWSF